MARSETLAPSARLRKLEEAKAAIDQLPRRQILSAKPMYQILRVSWTQLRNWCDELPGFEESGAFVRGDTGIKWEFNPRKVVKFLIAHFRRLEKAASEESRNIRRIVGANLLDAAPKEYGLDQLAKMVRLSRDLREERVEQGELTNADRAARAMRIFMIRIQEAALRSGQEADPNGRWNPEVRDQWEGAIQGLLLVIEREGQLCIKELRGGAAYTGEPEPADRGVVGRSVPSGSAGPAGRRAHARKAA